MSTALRTIAPTAIPDALVPAAHLHDLIAEKSRLERQLATLQLDLKSARASRSRYLAELRRCVQAPAIVGQSVVDKRLTLTYSNGRVVQLQPTADYTEDSTEYAMKWIEITPAPDTAKAIVDAAIEAVELGDDDVDEFDPTFRALAGLALHGMAVSAGDAR